MKVAGGWGGAQIAAALEDFVESQITQLDDSKYDLALARFLPMPFYVMLLQCVELRLSHVFQFSSPECSVVLFGFGNVVNNEFSLLPSKGKDCCLFRQRQAFIDRGWTCLSRCCSNQINVNLSTDNVRRSYQGVSSSPVTTSITVGPLPCATAVTRRCHYVTTCVTVLQLLHLQELPAGLQAFHNTAVPMVLAVQSYLSDCNGTICNGTADVGSWTGFCKGLSLCSMKHCAVSLFRNFSGRCKNSFLEKAIS